MKACETRGTNGDKALRDSRAPKDDVEYAINCRESIAVEGGLISTFERLPPVPRK